MLVSHHRSAVACRDNGPESWTRTHLGTEYSFNEPIHLVRFLKSSPFLRTRSLPIIAIDRRSMRSSYSDAVSASLQRSVSITPPTE